MAQSASAGLELSRASQLKLYSAPSACDQQTTSRAARSAEAWAASTLADCNASHGQLSLDCRHALAHLVHVGRQMQRLLQKYERLLVW